jgi:hypothetical protein
LIWLFAPNIKPGVTEVVVETGVALTGIDDVGTAMQDTVVVVKVISA